MLPGSVETSTDVVAAAVFADASAGATTGSPATSSIFASSSSREILGFFT
jgi:hypothetical protein